MRTCPDLALFLRLPLRDRLETFLEEDEVERVPAIESGCPLVDLRAFDSQETLRFHPSMEVFLYRKEAAVRLLEAGWNLIDLGFRLEICETYRPYQKQKRIYDQVWLETKQRLPDLTDDQIRKEVTPFIADPEVSPPHLSGGAVDLRLRDLDGNLVDMGADILTFDERSHLFAPGIEPAALAQRKILLMAMLHAGFAPLPSEWWHYSYGDKYWGAFHNRFGQFGTIRDPERFAFDGAASRGGGS